MKRLRAAAAAVALAALACSAPGDGSSSIEVEAPRRWPAGVDLRLRIGVSPALADADALLVVSAGNKIVSRVSTENGSARVVVPAAFLTRGDNRIAVKTGSERREVVVRVIPFVWVATPAALLLLGLLTAILRRRVSR